MIKVKYCDFVFILKGSKSKERRDRQISLVKNTATYSSQRRSFLRGHFDGAEVMRPPGAVSVSDYVDLCTRCGDCAAACPQAIIMADEDGFPKVDVSARACTFCGACSDACRVDAIVAADGWDWRADVGDRCLSVQGISCRVCEDHCDAQAIRFQLMTGGRSQPNISADTCTGCGACVAPCPADAISMRLPQSPMHANFSPASEFQL